MTPRRPDLLPALLPAWPRRLLPALVFGALAGTAMAPAAAQYTEPALGRLFTAPDERLRIDRDRASAPAVATPVEPAPAPPPVATAPPPPPPAPIRFTGVVRRSDGRATVWIDNEARETVLRRYRPGSAIPVDTPGGRVLAKPGQSIDPGDGTVQDAR